MGFFGPQRWGPVCSKRKRKSKTKSSKKVDEGLNRDLTDHNKVIQPCLGP